MLPGETTGGALHRTCEDCDRLLPIMVCRSNAGYYIGYQCKVCGPYGRETGYFKEKEEADEALKNWLHQEGPLERMRT